MTLSDSWDTPPSNPNNRRSSVSETGRQINPRIFVSDSSYKCFSDETLSGAKLFKRFAELLCHFARGNPPAEQRPWTCSAICISSWLESAAPQISSTYRPYFKGATASGYLCPSSSTNWRSTRTERKGAGRVPYVTVVR